MKRLARTDLAIHSRQLLHQSMWCGVVCGLAIVLTALNALPPVDVQYFVMGKVIASPIRAQALRQSLNESAESEPGQARLQRLTLLDEQPAVPASHLQASPPILLLGVVGIWQSRCTQERFQQWINSMALGSDSQRAVASTSTSHELRVARWEYEAAQHYRAHHEFLGG